MRVMVAEPMTGRARRSRNCSPTLWGFVGAILVVDYRRRSLRAPFRDDTKSYLLVEIDRGRMAVR
jgi:hypothetical protein